MHLDCDHSVDSSKEGDPILLGKCAPWLEEHVSNVDTAAQQNSQILSILGMCEVAETKHKKSIYSALTFIKIKMVR